MKTLSLHVTFGTNTKLISTTQTNFFSDVAAEFNIPPDEIDIFEIVNKMKNKISVSGLKDVQKIEIKRKQKSPKVNGTSALSGPSEATTSTQLSIIEICRKLTENRSLTGLERKLIRTQLEDTLKRKRDPVENDSRPQMKSKKVQVNPETLFALRSTYTQTDELINYQHKPSTSKNPEDIIVAGKRLAIGEKIDQSKAAEIMKKSYDQRRHSMLLDRPLVCFIKEKYPLLFSLPEVQNELDRIFYDGKCQEFISNIEVYAKFVLDLARHDDPLLISIKQKVSSLATADEKKYATEVGSLLMASSINHETRSYLKLPGKTSEYNRMPHIEANTNLDGLYKDQHLFKVFVEGELLCEATDFKQAILCLVAAYFIFNIKYPDENFNTLVFFEKLYLKANDTEDGDVDEIVQQNVKFVQLKFDSHK